MAHVDGLIQVKKTPGPRTIPYSPSFLSPIGQEITPFSSSYALCEINLAPAMAANNGEERTRRDIIDHAETAYTGISRVLVSAHLS